MPVNRLRQVRDDERGIVVVWVALMMVVLLGSAALAVDGANLRLVKEREQKAADAAALAGVVHLPDDPDAALAAARDIANRNTFTDDGATGVNVEVLSNTLKVTVTRSVDNTFARVLGIDTTTVAAKATAAYERPAAATVTPVDLVLILDRTSSMTAADLDNVKGAANALLGSLDPAIHHVALGVLGPSRTTSTCAGGAFGLSGPLSGSATWLAAPSFTTPPVSDYRDANSQIRRTITCLNHSSVGTDLTEPMRVATDYLRLHDVRGARQGIILMTDGQPNTTTDACDDAADQATTTKDVGGIEIVTIGFGVDRGAVNCPDDSGPYRGGSVPVTRLLADMASPVDGVPAADGCRVDPDAENSDGDNFFCEPRDTGNLADVFVQAASHFTGSSRPRLIN